MKFNIRDKVSFSISDYGDPVSNFIKEEYRFYIQDIDKENNWKGQFYIEIVEDKVSKSAFKIRNPIICDSKGVAISDYNGNLARIDFGKLGCSTYKVSCDKDFNLFFFANLLEYLLYLEFTNLGYSFCHASSFVFNGKAILCPGWRNTGKTNLLLSFLKDGAEFLSDDWILIHKDGGLFSLPKRINLLHYNYLPNIDLIDSFDPTLASFSETVLKLINRSIYQYSDLNENQLKDSLKRRLHFEELFKRKRMLKSKNIDFIFFLNHNNNIKSVNIKKYENNKLQDRMLRVLDFEQSPFKSAYDFYKFSSGNENFLIELARNRSRDIFSSAFENVTETFQIDVFDQNQSEIIKNKITGIVG